MFDNFRRFGRICSVISVGSVRFGSLTGFIHSRSELLPKKSPKARKENQSELVPCKDKPKQTKKKKVFTTL